MEKVRSRAGIKQAWGVSAAQAIRNHLLYWSHCSEGSTQRVYVIFPNLPNSVSAARKWQCKWFFTCESTHAVELAPFFAGFCRS